MLVSAIPVGTKLIDTVAALTPTELAAFKAAGIGGVIVYLNGNLTSALLSAAHDIGMGVVPVNFSHVDGWLPSAALGAADATNSVRALTTLGVPLRGLDDWCDVEGCGGDPTAYCEAWCERATNDGAGRVPKEYVGAGALLTGHQHYLLPFKGYWHSCSRAIPEPDCGFQMLQAYPPNQMLAGVEIDYDFVFRDFENRAPTWLIGG